MYRIYLCVLVISIVSLFTGCKGDDEVIHENDVPISGAIKEAIINNIIENREGCNFSNISFVVEINGLEDSIRILPSGYDMCERELQNKFYSWEIEDSLISYLFLTPQESIHIKKNQKVDIKFQSISKIDQVRLVDMLDFYEKKLSSDFYITLLIEGEKIKITKIKDFKINLMIDGKKINKNDSLLMNKQFVPAIR